MIVVDTSALLAILEEEQDAAVYAKAIAEADPPLISAASVVEVGIVMLSRHGSRALGRVSRLIQEAGFRVESVTAQHAHQALEAYAAYGKGQKSKAGLNYGDCFSYALAKATGLPLLFKGRDFSETDILAALPRA
jgi:ribonuclease VapC